MPSEEFQTMHLDWMARAASGTFVAVFANADGSAVLTSGVARKVQATNLTNNFAKFRQLKLEIKLIDILFGEDEGLAENNMIPLNLHRP